MGAKLPILPAMIFCVATLWGAVSWTTAVDYPRDPRLVPAWNYPRDGVAQAAYTTGQGGAPAPQVQPAANVQLATATAAPPVAAPTPTAPAAQPTSGTDFIAASARMLENQVSIETKIRFESQLFEKRMVGTGSYRQGWNAARTWRLELVMRENDDQCLFLQVCNGHTIWLHQRAGDLQELRVIDLATSTKGLEGVASQAGAPPINWGAGGLPQFISGLAAAFEFQRPVVAQHDGAKALKLTGKWRREYLAAIMPDQKDKILKGKSIAWDKLAPHLPDEIIVYLRTSDLFPLGIEYRRTPVLRFYEKFYAEAEPVTLVEMEFFNAHTGMTIDPSTFEWRSGNIDVIDHTPEYITDVQSLNQRVIENRAAGEAEPKPEAK